MFIQGGPPFVLLGFDITEQIQVTQEDILLQFISRPEFDDYVKQMADEWQLTEEEALADKFFDVLFSEGYSYLTSSDRGGEDNRIIFGEILNSADEDHGNFERLALDKIDLEDRAVSIRTRFNIPHTVPWKIYMGHGYD